jgi:hypothetical protein
MEEETFLSTNLKKKINDASLGQSEKFRNFNEILRPQDPVQLPASKRLYV